MKKTKIIIASLTLILTGFILGACSSKSIASQDWPLKIWYQNKNGMMETYRLVDEDTGVNYIVISGEIYGAGLGTSITPRLNADGSLYVGE